MALATSGPSVIQTKSPVLALKSRCTPTVPLVALVAALNGAPWSSVKPYLTAALSASLFHGVSRLALLVGLTR